MVERPSGEISPFRRRKQQEARIDAMEERRKKEAIELQNDIKKRRTLRERVVSETEQHPDELTLNLAEARWQVMWLDLKLGDTDWKTFSDQQNTFWNEVEENSLIAEALRAEVTDRGRRVFDSAGSPLNRANQLRENIIASNKLSQYRTQERLAQ